MNVASFLAAAAVLSATLPARAADEPSPAPWALRVRLSSDDADVELLRSVGGQQRVVCKAPCGELVRFQPSDVFTLEGPGIVPSEPFSFKPRNGELSLRVTTGSQTARSFGAALLVGGGATFAVAGVALAPQAVFGNVFCDGDPACISGNAGRRSAWFGALAAGGVLALAGLLTVLANPQTRFEVER